MLAGKRIDSSGSCGGSDDEHSHLWVRARINPRSNIALVFLDQVTNKVSNELQCLTMYVLAQYEQGVDRSVDESGENARNGDRHRDVHQDLGLHSCSSAGRHCRMWSLPCAQVMYHPCNAMD